MWYTIVGIVLTLTLANCQHIMEFSTEDDDKPTVTQGPIDTTIPKVVGATNCTGEFTFGEFRSALCSSDTVCNPPADGKEKKTQISFHTPTSFTGSLTGMQVKIAGAIAGISVGSKTFPCDGTIDQADTDYVLTANATIPSEAAGKKVTITIQLLNGSTALVCVKATIQFQ